MDFDILKSTTEEFHNIYITKPAYNSSLLFLLKHSSVTIAFSTWAKKKLYILVTRGKPIWSHSTFIVFPEFCSMSPVSFMQNKTLKAKL